MKKRIYSVTAASKYVFILVSQLFPLNTAVLFVLNSKTKKILLTHVMSVEYV